MPPPPPRTSAAGSSCYPPSPPSGAGQNRASIVFLESGEKEGRGEVNWGDGMNS